MTGASNLSEESSLFEVEAFTKLRLRQERAFSSESLPEFAQATGYFNENGGFALQNLNIGQSTK
jgi:hypothetical protein